VQFVQEIVESFESLRSDQFSCQLQGESIFTLWSLREFNGDETGSTLSHSLEDNPGCEDVSLTPNLLIGIIVHETADALVQHRQPASVVNFFSLLLAFIGAENVKRLLELNQMESHRVRSAFFVTTVHFAELLRPGFIRSIPRCDWLVSEGVHDRWIPILLTIFIDLEKFSCSVTKKLMESNNKSKTLF